MNNKIGDCKLGGSVFLETNTKIVYYRVIITNKKDEGIAFRDFNHLCDALKYANTMLVVEKFVNK